jgi:hypothetical protein
MDCIIHKMMNQELKAPFPCLTLSRLGRPCFSMLAAQPAGAGPSAIEIAEQARLQALD